MRKMVLNRDKQSFIKAVTILISLQGLAWFSLGITGIAFYNAAPSKMEEDIKNSQSYSDYLGRIIYKEFLIQSHGNKVIRPQDFAVFLWVYTILSALWIAASIDQYTVSQNKRRQRFDLFVLGIIVLLTSIIDVVLVSLLARDLNACPFDLTNTAVTDPGSMASGGTAVDCQLAIGIIMTIAARGYILLIINVVLAITMIKFGAKVLRTPSLLTYDNNTIPRARVPEARKASSPANNVYFGDSDLFSNSTAHRNRNITPAALTNKNQNLYF